MSTSGKRRYEQRFIPCWTKKIGELFSTNNKVIGVHVDLPLVDVTHSAYANAFEFGPRDFATGGILPAWNFPPIGLRAFGECTLGFAPKF